MSPQKERKAAPLRYRLAVPVADEAVNRWLGMQDNVSASLRTVVREWIERNGFEDATCKPVTQLPRRGRPPGSSAERGDQDDEIEFDEPSGPDQEIEGLGYEIAQATGRSSEGQAQAARARTESTASTASTASTSAVGDDPGMPDMDDIFSSGRNR